MQKIPDTADIHDLIGEAGSGEKYALAKLISLIERENSREFRKDLFQNLKESGFSAEKSITVGFTGTPGVGKSSLIGAISLESLKRSDKKLAIVAVDPSSNVSGGSILGDRTRVVLPIREKRIYFRSQANQLELGGVNPHTYHVIRLLRYFFDYVFIETVGIGQSEIEVSKFADFSFLILQPLGGDQVQFLKSGIMEVPDAFIMNKCDEVSLADSSYHILVTSLEFLKDTLKGSTIPPIFRTSIVNKSGITELLNFILQLSIRKSKETETKTQIQKWIRSEYGNFGLEIFSRHSQKFSEHLDFEDNEILFLQVMKGHLADGSSYK